MAGLDLYQAIHRLHFVKVLAIIAFFGLQMSMFACASNAHMYRVNDDYGAKIEHAYAHADAHHGANSVNEIHASSHTFVSLEETGIAHPAIAAKTKFAISCYLFTPFPQRIDQPPKA